MSSREYIKSEIDTLPDTILVKLQEFITFQKFSLGLFEHDKKIISDIAAASIGSTDFWDNADDEVWDNV